MMNHAQLSSTFIYAAICGVAFVIYLIMRCGRDRRARWILVLTLFGVTMVALALIEIVGERTAERGYSNGGSSEPMPALSGIFATAGTTEESGSEDETVSASVQVGSGDGDDSTPAVRIESLKKGNGETGAVVAAGKGKAGVTVQTSAEPSRALSSHSTRMRLAGKIGGFSLLLVLAYLFLDAGRRQRYIWPRRVAIVAAFLGVCAFLSRIVPLM